MLTGAGGGGALLIIPREREKLVQRLKEMNVLYFDTSTTGAGIFKRSE
jgi:galactokinase/mevalonate kinase-like predicted kinase